jgi:hypothetical protein
MSYQQLHKTLISTLLIISVFNLNAQIKPDATNAVPGQTGSVLPFIPSDYTTNPLFVNYVRVWQPQQANSDNTYFLSSSRTVDQVNISTQYFDGLGRPLQTVGWQSSPAKQDLVSPVYYDAYGREPYKFLPYTSSTASASGNPAQLKMNPFTEQSTFYNGTYKTEQPALNNENFFYSKTNFEESPLDRVTTNLAPGNSWVGSEGGVSEKNSKIQYLFNIISDDVKIWTVDIDLAVNITDNENGTQDVKYSWTNTTIAPNTTVLYLYRILGSTGSWTTLTVNNGIIPYTGTIPIGSYEYALQ